MDLNDTHDGRARSSLNAPGIARSRRPFARWGSPSSRIVGPAGCIVFGVVCGLCFSLSFAGCADATRDLRESMQGARHYSAGSEALDRGDATTALRELREAARLVPHASEIQNHLGIAYWQAGDVVLARSAFETALELDCENEAARQNLGRLDAQRSRAAANDGRGG